MPSFDRPTNAAIPPSPWIVRFSALIKQGGCVLDVAAGHGRHAWMLHGAGFQVVAVDIDISGLEYLENKPKIEIMAADLESTHWPLEGRLFDGIVVTNYLYRPHFPQLISALNHGGVLIFETFGAGNEYFGRPRNPNFLMKPGELLNLLTPHLHIVAYEHGEETTPRPSVRQRICAVKGDGPYVLP
ncbi:MAG: SAM-dependent methyltransferase [Candidatus Marinimicrobia bacterium]|nr:SAM-dependent methyltransferase [Candidatus Neomarinimicrobiota bacterium]